MLPQPRRILWQDAFTLYCAERVDLSQTTTEQHRYLLERFFKDCRLLPCEIGKLHILRYLQRFECAGTYNVYAGALRGFFTWFAENYNLPNPCHKLKKRPIDYQYSRRVITHTEYLAIYNSHPYPSRDTAVFIANTGLRVSEFCSVKPEQIQNRQLTVLGKGKKFRTVPLNSTAFSLLSRLNFSKSRSAVNKSFDKLADRLHLPRFGPHALRHYFATRLIERGANIADVSKLLGHASVSTTIAYYYHPDDLGGVVDLLD